jgi:peptidoglycan/xylan/chitin deacetylase (PgdA/CDA1 family)
MLDELLVWAGAESAARPTYRPLSSMEVVSLTQGEPIDVGAHTMMHSALPALPAASQHDEILESKTQLKEIMVCPMSSFSYPYGSLSEETVEIVRTAEFACACSTFAGIVELATDPFRVPRMCVQDWDGPKFGRQLSRWFDG